MGKGTSVGVAASKIPIDSVGNDLTQSNKVVSENNIQKGQSFVCKKKKIYTRKDFLKKIKQNVDLWESYENNNQLALDINRPGSISFENKSFNPEDILDGKETIDKNKLNAELKKLGFKQEKIDLIEKFYAQTPQCAMNLLTVSLELEASKLNQNLSPSDHLMSVREDLTPHHINIFHDDKGNVFYQIKAHNFSLKNRRNEIQKTFSGEMDAIFELTDNGFKLVTYTVTGELINLLEKRLKKFEQETQTIAKLKQTVDKHMDYLINVIETEFKQSHPNLYRQYGINNNDATNSNFNRFIRDVNDQIISKSVLDSLNSRCGGAINEYNAIKKIDACFKTPNFDVKIDRIQEELNKYEKLLNKSKEQNKSATVETNKSFTFVRAMRSFLGLFSCGKKQTFNFWKPKSQGEKTINEMRKYLPPAPKLK